jgi:hypothetical protein
MTTGTNGHAQVLVSGITNYYTNLGATVLIDICSRETAIISATLLSGEITTIKIGYRILNERLEVWAYNDNYIQPTQITPLNFSEDFELASYKTTSAPGGLSYIAIGAVIKANIINKYGVANGVTPIIIENSATNNYNEGLRINRSNNIHSGILIGGKQGSTGGIDPVGYDETTPNPTTTLGNASWWINVGPPKGDFEISQRSANSNYGLKLTRDDKLFFNNRELFCGQKKIGVGTQTGIVLETNNKISYYNRIVNLCLVNIIANGTPTAGMKVYYSIGKMIDYSNLRVRWQGRYSYSTTDYIIGRANVTA